MKLYRSEVKSIHPYPNNPRKNDQAVDAVAESIRQCEYMQPIIVDENNVILAGHTRLKALQKLGVKECDCIIVSGLTEEQKKKYRYLDNKTGEAAFWDIEKLSKEIEGLDFGDLDFFNVKGETFDVTAKIEREPVGAIEYGEEAFGNDSFKYECPCCGYLFNA